LLWTGASTAAPPLEIVIASYNLENYRGEPTAEDDPAQPPKPKPEASIAAVVEIIREMKPDVLGICEMGRAPQFADFRQRLQRSGLDYPEAEYVEGPDRDRHLALLSRFPIISRQSRTDIVFDLHGVPQKVRRGFLDVTLQVTPSYELRLVGAHLKSKFPSRDGEGLLRRHEAQLLRRHVEEILSPAPQTNLLLYGDFNELKNEPAVQAIMGVRGTSLYLADLPLRDAAGDRWTHYMKAADLYSRIDYFFASPGVLREVVLGHSGIHRSERWNEASDHRPIYTAILPVNR
jgi:endonuclease/exonuclease/phosphatase family metal-dependent hydrolase